MSRRCHNSIYKENEHEKDHQNDRPPDLADPPDRGFAVNPVADGNLYPLGNGYLRFFTYKQQDSVVALAFYVEDKHFTQEEYLDFLDNVVVDGCDRMGYTSDSEFDDEGYNPTDGQKNLIYAFYNIPDDVTFTSDSIHLPKLVKATEAAE